MKIEENAKKNIEKYMGKIIAGLLPLKGKRDEIEREYISHLYESAEDIARSRGSDITEVEDVERAKKKMGGIDSVISEIKEAYYGGNDIKRAGFWIRFLAFWIDGAIATFPIVLFVSSELMDGKFFILGQEFGFVATILFCYFFLLEGFFNTTPGKRLLNLWVLKENKDMITPIDAFVRNISKPITPVFTIDVLVLAFGSDKQRAFDKVAKTIVVQLMQNKKTKIIKIVLGILFVGLYAYIALQTGWMCIHCPA